MLVRSFWRQFVCEGHQLTQIFSTLRIDSQHGLIDVLRAARILHHHVLGVV